MARKLRNVASRGSVNNIILESLMTGQKYGYEIIKEVEEKTNGKIKLKQPSLYSSLKRFETKNIITSYWGDSEIGGRRHYYLLTDYGRKYCEKLLHKNEDNIDIDLDSEFEEEIDDTTNTSQEDILENDEQVEDQTYEVDESGDEEIDINQKYNNFSVEDKMKELLGEENIDDINEEIIQETNPEPTPRETFLEDVRQDIIDNNPILTDKDNNEEILNQLYDEMDKDELENPSEEYIEPVVEQIVPDHNFYKPVPLSDYKNERYEESYNILYNKETPVDHKIVEEKTESHTPQQVVATRKKKIITDEYGITKLVYEDEENWNNRPQASAIMTNVNNINIDLVKLANQPEKQKRNILDELSDEEREERHIKFVQKFETITNERKAPTPQTNNTETKPNIEYKEKLSNLFVEDAEETVDQTPYLEKEREVVSTQNIAKRVTDTIDDSTINVKVYSKSKNQESSSTYLQVNKVKFAFGIIMLILMLLELTVAMVILKDKGLLYKDKMWAFQVCYIVVGIVCLLYCVPVFISPNKQSANTFKLSYAIIFGLLGFFVSLILIYTLNTFGGLSLENVKYFTPTIVAPLVLASNFIVGPVLYKILTLNKKFYQ